MTGDTSNIETVETFVLKMTKKIMLSAPKRCTVGFVPQAFRTTLCCPNRKFLELDKERQQQQQQQQQQQK
jgi:hypothetical protein